MLGLSVAPTRLVPFPLLPAGAFGADGSTLREKPRRRRRRSRRFETAFRSPGAAAPFGATSPGSSLRACLFSALQVVTRARSALGSPPRSASAVRGGSAPRTRCPSSEPAILEPPQALLPFGFFRTLRFLARPDSAPGSSPSPVPTAPSLPSSAFLTGQPNRIIAPRQPPRLRLAVPRTSRNHYHLAMQPPALSTPVDPKRPAFARTFSLFASIGYGRHAVGNMLIKHRGR